MTLHHLTLHVFGNLVHGHMSGAFDKSLNVFGPCTLNKFAHGVELGKLSCVVGIINRTGTESVAKTDGYVVSRTNVANIVKMLVEKTLTIVFYTPL